MSIIPLCGKWKPALAIKFFLLVLVSTIALTFLKPELWPWSVGFVFAFHLGLTIAGLLPRSTLLGLNITRLPDDAAQRGEVAITIDDGPDPVVTPQVLDILDHYQAKATFFCIGRQAEKFPELCREIVRRGHAIENHSLSHYWYLSLLDPWSIHREVSEAQKVLVNICGQTPKFFRPTAGLRNPALEPVLVHCNLKLCSWSKRGFDTRVNNPDAVLRSLTRDLKGGDILLLHDGNAARSSGGTSICLEVLPRLLEALAQSKLRSVTLRDAMA
jgi:peptidoglycan/xylan/chitin deacetylase (PgdA/CDA1 family)